jgi:uncharacterized damage-inducible protein DinB
MMATIDSPFAFLAEMFETECLKTLTVWSEFVDSDLAFRPSPLARSVQEQMVHQCQSEDGWFSKMLGIPTGLSVLPAREDRLSFIEHYAEVSGRRLEALRHQPANWFEGEAEFFGTPRTRTWVLVRRIAHTAHHRGQLTIYLRLLGRSLYSTYGPTADTGGLPANGAKVVYRYDSVEDLLAGERNRTDARGLPGPGARPVTERGA